MNIYIENSGFENFEANTVIPSNASKTELLPFQSNNSLVYKTRINDKWLLLKRIKPEFRTHPLYINAFEKEFNLGFNLDHPHIVKYLNKGTDSDGLYLLAEYIDGYSLRSIIQKNPQGISDLKLIEKILYQLLDALNYLHKQQIFHLDLKPENIIITHKGNNVKIIDLGLSGSDSYVYVSSGTKTYRSPEQLNNPENADARSDFYSLGIILLELFTGATDFSGLRKVSNRYKKIIEKCIEPLQENRIQSADEILGLLNKKSWSTTFSIVGMVLLIILSIVIGTKYFHSDKNKPIAIILPPNLKLHNNNIPILDTLPKIKAKLEIEAKAKIEAKPKTKGEQGLFKNYKLDHDALMESKRLLDSLAIANNAYLNAALPETDSIYCCKLGFRLFSNFIEQVKLYDSKPSDRSRKWVLVDIKSNCRKAYLDSLHNYLSKYQLGSVIHSKLSDLSSKYSDYSELRIDSIVWKNRIRK